jgi:hypothetical protein
MPIRHYKNEQEMYEPVRQWLFSYLTERHKTSDIQVYDVSRVSLATFIERQGWQNLFPSEWRTWDIHVDVAGFIIARDRAELSLVECKLRPITLGDLSQLLGYSRVAKPLMAFLVSPAGISGSLTSLLLTYNRWDILVYDRPKGKIPRSIALGTWDPDAEYLDNNAIIGPQ